MIAQSYDIQDLVELCSVSRRNIYFYIQQELLPPPQGAGLAARYGPEHVLRLRLIPHLRKQGLRLDQIRERFAALQLEEMERLLEQLQQDAPPPSSYPAAAIAQNLENGQPCLRYDLPGGIVLIVPAGLRPPHRELAERLVRAVELDLTLRKE